MKTLPCALVLIALSLSAGRPGARVAPVASAGPPAPAVAAAQQDESFEGLVKRAEELYAQRSYALARRLYQDAAKLELEGDQRRWVEFRLADTAWRSAAATDDPDTTTLEQAAAELERIVGTVQREEDHDRIWAEAEESLGHYQWDRQRSQNWGGAWPHYQLALDFWAGSSDVDVARRRYLDIVFAAAQPRWREQYWGRGIYGSYLPVQVLENAVAIAESTEDLARAHYLLGSFYYNYGQNTQFRGRVERELGAVLELGKTTEWYDDALYYLGNYLKNNGRAERDESGQWVWRQDFVGAVDLYRRLLREFERGETAYHDDAEARIRQITAPSLQASVDQFFLPDSEIAYRLSWRNLDHVDLALYRADLTRNVDFRNDDGPGSWIDSIRLEGLEPARTWRHDTGDEGDHRPDQAQLVLDGKLAPGAWVLEATGRGLKARALVLVSDVALTAKSTDEKVLAWLTDVKTGEPVPGARLRLWQRFYANGRYRWRERQAETKDDGTFLFALGRTDSYAEYFLAAAAGERQAFVQDGSSPSPQPADGWRIHATTDRSAYRPGQDVQWKIVARHFLQTGYVTPANEELGWELVDPLGSIVQKGVSRLNAFGSAWSSFATEEVMPLGEYRIQFFVEPSGSRNLVGSATLFRLEEYKRPEFEVSVRVPEDPEGSGRPALYQLGDRVEAEIDATYYFGGPVSEANVEVFVYQRPFAFAWPKEREFPWFYDEAYRGWWGGNGQQVSHQILKTDLAGKAKVAFDTPDDAGYDLEYTIEARVVDASRREISGTGSVRVTRTEYFAQVEAEHAIFRPDAAVELSFRTVDPGGNPLPAAGEVKVTRQRWLEVWRGPTGEKIEGAELAAMRREGAFPPPDVAGYRLEFQGYEQDVVATASLATDDDGEAAWEFTPDRDGTYVVAWHGVDGRGNDVDASTTVFVADESTRELGYLSGGIEILVDQDTVEAGQDAVLMLAAPASGRWVLFTVEGADLHHYEVLHIDGTVKLLRLPVSELYVPNVFLGAVSLADGEAFEDRVELIVPPVKQFLDVEVTQDRETYLPGDEGTLTVDVRDHDGEPVAAELSLAVVDDSLAYIQGDYAVDPRRFFYGEKRALVVRTHGTAHHGSFHRLVKGKDGEVRDERYAMFDDEAGGFGPASTEVAARRQLGKKEGRSAGLAANAPMEMAEEKSAIADRMDANQVFQAGQVAGGGGPAARVRSDFRETALWLPDVVTDETGRATVTVRFPDSTTRWSATVRVADRTSRFGTGGATTRTRQPLIARLQAPRFFLTGDELTLSANLNNNTDQPMTVKVTLEPKGLELIGRKVDGRVVGAIADGIQVPAQGQTRVDWRVRAVDPGEAHLLLTAVGAEHSDAVETRLPVYPHGIEALEARSGKLDTGEIAFAIELPVDRGDDRTSMTVQVSPSLAVTMLDALPYLVDYPYGCTEQTLSRFLPSVIVARTMRDFGLSPEEAMQRAFGGIEPQFVDRTHPEGKKALEKLDEMVEQGLARLYDFQHADGGWAWWKTGDSDRFMTAYVLWGLSLARDAGTEVRPAVLENAARWLARELVEEENALDDQAWMLHALAVYGGETGDSRSKEWMEKAYRNLWNQRDHLNAYGRSLLAIAAHEMGHDEQAHVLVANLMNGVDVDESPDTSVVRVGRQTTSPFVMKTAHWGQDGVHRRWSEGGVEATAFALRALMAIEPENELVEPVMNWLVKNRRGAQWSNTRDTAICVLALDDYLSGSGELGSAVAYEVTVNGLRVASEELEKDELLRAPRTFTVDPEWLRDGQNVVEIKKTAGEGPLYFAAYARFFSLEDPIPARANELFARREYYRLVGRETLLKGYVYDRKLLRDGDSVQSGERIEVIVTVEAKNNLEYLLFEDLKPAGFEAVQVRSGEDMVARQLKSGEVATRFAQDGGRRRGGAGRTSNDRRIDERGYTGRTHAVHQELRDRKAAMFVDKLEDGTWEMRYDLRAEVPGRFHALPLLGRAMYVPEICCNGQELRLEVLDASAE